MSNERFLPLGTIVMLKNSKLPVMIIGYSVIPKDNNELIYDYNATFFPMGTIDTSIVTPFNHNQIEKIIFMGYEDEDSKTYREGLKKVDLYMRMSRLINPQFKEEE